MILGFKRYFDWKENKQPVPTNFREKILAGAGYLSTKEIAESVSNVVVTHQSSIYVPKLHTMRLDPHNRWRAGMGIQMVYRGPKYSILDHFNKGIPELETCKGVQQVRIHWTYKNEYLIGSFLPTKTVKGPHGRFKFMPKVWIDDHQLTELEILVLAKNDGFNSVEDFFRWFKEDWSGKIIHWSSLKY